MPAEQEESLPLPSETEEALSRTVALPKLPREKQEKAAADPVSDTPTPDHNETEAEPDIASVDTVIISPSALPQELSTEATDDKTTALSRGAIARALASEVPDTPDPDNDGNQPTDKLDGDNRTRKQRKVSSARRGLGHDVAAFIDESQSNG